MFFPFHPDASHVSLERRNECPRLGLHEPIEPDFHDGFLDLDNDCVDEPFLCDECHEPLHDDDVDEGLCRQCQELF